MGWIPKDSVLWEAVMYISLRATLWKDTCPTRPDMAGVLSQVRARQAVNPEDLD